MITEITKGQLLALQLGRLKDAGQAQAAPRLDGQAQQRLGGARVRALAREILGANGIVDEYPVIRHMLNLESVYTYEGTHDIHTLVIGEAVTGIPAYNPPMRPPRSEAAKARRAGRSGPLMSHVDRDPRAGLHPRHRAGGDRRRAHHGPAATASNRTRSPSRRCARSSTRSRSPAASSSARASATRRRCSTSARRSARCKGEPRRRRRRHRRRPARGHQPLRHRRPERHRGARRRRARRPAPRPRHLHGEDHRRPDRARAASTSTPRSPRTCAHIAKAFDARRRGPDDRRARPRRATSS